MGASHCSTLTRHQRVCVATHASYTGRVGSARDRAGGSLLRQDASKSRIACLCRSSQTCCLTWQQLACLPGGGRRPIAFSVIRHRSSQAHNSKPAICQGAAPDRQINFSHRRLMERRVAQGRAMRVFTSCRCHLSHLPLVQKWGWPVVGENSKRLSGCGVQRHARGFSCLGLSWCFLFHQAVSQGRR